MNQKIYASELKRDYVLNIHNKIAVSISGGSDSDIVLDLIEKYFKNLDEKYSFQQYTKSREYIFFNTGLEYQATFRQLDYLEKKYGIEIKRYKPKKTIPTAVKEHGQPFLSKYVSEMMWRLQSHGFQWEDESFDELVLKYPKCISALRWWTNNQTENGMFNISRNRLLKEFIMSNPPNFKISNKCCKYAKKDLSTLYIKENNPDLMVIGVRRAEGGQRTFKYKTCFVTDGDIDMYYPILHYADQDKEEYEIQYDIKHSDCYTQYGMKRTGCAGCPFGRNYESELFILKQYEPKLHKAVTQIFKESYDYTMKFRRYVEENDNGFVQYKMFQKEEL